MAESGDYAPKAQRRTRCDVMRVKVVGAVGLHKSREIEVFEVFGEKFGILRFFTAQKAKIIVLFYREKKFLF